MARLARVAAAASLIMAAQGAFATADALTPKHEAGRCAMRGHCGSKGFFGKPLPCLDNGLAEKPDDDFAASIAELCGPKWVDSNVCCTRDQVCRGTACRVPASSEQIEPS